MPNHGLRNRGNRAIVYHKMRTRASNPVLRMKRMTPSFRTIGTGVTRMDLSSFGKGGIVLGVFPDLSAPAYTLSMERFGTQTTKLRGAIILYVSVSLPFTRSHFYSARKLSGIVPLSMFHDHSFITRCNLRLTSKPLRNLVTHTIVMISRDKGMDCARLIRGVSRRPSCRTTLGTTRWTRDRKVLVPFLLRWVRAPAPASNY